MDDLVLFFGNQARLARALKVSRSAVSHWMRDGFLPPYQAIRVEELTEGKFKAKDLVEGDQ